MASAIPAFPRVLAITRPDGTGEVTINGTSHPIQATDSASARQACLDYVQTWVVDRIGRTVRIEARDHTGTHHLYLHVGGHVTEATPTGPPHPDLEPAAEHTGPRQTSLPTANPTASGDDASVNGL